VKEMKVNGKEFSRDGGVQLEEKILIKINEEESEVILGESCFKLRNKSQPYLKML